MSIAVLDGRVFETADHLSQHGNVVVSRSAANLLWPGQKAIGRRLQQRGHLIDLRLLGAGKIAGECKELLPIAAGGDQGRHVDGLLMMRDHVGEEREILAGV